VVFTTLFWNEKFRHEWWGFRPRVNFFEISHNNTFHQFAENGVKNMKAGQRIVGEVNGFQIIYDEKTGEYFEKPKWGGQRGW
jgi:hypothetical protein